ncbi:MAG TPA: tetratricopeptide repeat protein [Deltaproteobacteria bacterium]|nr:tetratricopeptide repeat protein [Deltaproteobacteria bacterium]
MGVRAAWTAAVLAVLLAAAGCASAPEPVPGPPQSERASQLNVEGVAAAARGEYALALLKFEAALALSRSVDDRRTELAALRNLAAAYTALGRLERAGEAAQEALEIAAEAGDHRAEAALWGMLAKLAYMRGDAAGALGLLDNAARLDARFAHADRGARLNLRAMALLKLGRRDEAAAVLDEALKLNEAAGLDGEVANSLRLRADMLSGEGRDDEAAALYERALEIDRRLGRSSRIFHSLYALGRIALAGGDEDGALGLLDRALKVALAAGLSEGAGECIDAMAEIYAGRGDDEMVRFYRAMKEKVERGSGPGATGPAAGEG